MVPMDRNIDHLVFETGETVTVPFDVLLIFATNLAPSQLGDEAFYRRIRHKVRISDPDIHLFKEILRKVARKHGISYDEETRTTDRHLRRLVVPSVESIHATF
jgi:hypothetical protein